MKRRLSFRQEAVKPSRRALVLTVDVGVLGEAM